MLKIMTSIPLTFSVLCSETEAGLHQENETTCMDSFYLSALTKTSRKEGLREDNTNKKYKTVHLLILSSRRRAGR